MNLSVLTRGAGSAFEMLRRYFGILIALLWREQKIRRVAPAESIINMLEPVFLIGVMSFAWWFLYRRQSSPLGGSPVLFFGTGFFAKYFFIYLSRRIGPLDNPFRRYSIERRLDHIFSHMILRIIDYTVLGILIFTVISIFFSPNGIPHDFVKLILAASAIACLGFGVGVLNIILRRLWWIWDFIFPPIMRALVLFSGVVFLIEYTSPSARAILSYNPMLHAIILFRQSFYPQYYSIILDTTYLAYCSIFAVSFGLVLERATRRYEG